MRAATFLALAVGIALLAASIGLGVRERSQKRSDADYALQRKVAEESRLLEAYFERARSNLLLTASNPAFLRFYREPGERLARVRAHGPTIVETENALDFLERLFPRSIGEACFIDRGGAENSRVVRGERAALKDLSPDETKNPFFYPTLALRPGQVYQAEPYVSPDTGEWVISNSTPIALSGRKVAMVHFENTLEAFRREAVTLARGYHVAIVSRKTQRVVVDTRYALPAGAPLGRPNDRRFAPLVASGRIAGVATIVRHRSAFQRLRRQPGNANEWFVVVTDPRPLPALGGVGWAPLGMGGAALILLLVAALSFRSSRRELHAAANTDALTGLENRRKLMIDLEELCERAEKGGRFALVLYDLDGFKVYNDSFGHLPGDALLRRVAQKLRAAIQDWGTAYRLGGDEFCVLARLRGQEAAQGVAALGAESLAEEGEGFSITASYGAVVLPDEARTSSDVLAAADLRMYAAKQKGRRSPARQTTDVLVRAQHEKSPLLGPHVCEVADLAEAVSRRMGLSDHRLHAVRQAAELHDVGKMAIPDTILDKPGPLTEDEWEMIREHTLIGERILAAAPALREISVIVRSTHEHFDGAGYPDRLAGERIPIEARIINAADAFCAMTTDRPYRQARSFESAIGELRRCAGGQFDPAVVEALIEVLRERPVTASRERTLRRAS